MKTPTQMTVHGLNPLKGWPSQQAVDFVAKLASVVTIDQVWGGRVAHLNADGDYEMGLPDVVQAGHMAIFLFQTSTDNDVTVGGGDPATEADVYVAATPSGNIGGFAAAAAMELETTEFEPESSLGDTYAPGDCLTAVASNTDAATGGRITRAAAYEKPICGVVSRAVRANTFRRNVLAFWPVWLPKLTTSVSGLES